MKFQQLSCFDEIARTQNFTTAANRLFLSQPSVSYNIRELERELGVSLLERGLNSSKAELTEYGKILVEPVREILQQVKECELVFADLCEIEKKRISVVTAEAMIYSVMPELVKYAAYQLPNWESVLLRVKTCYSMEDLEGELQSGAADLGIYPDKPQGDLEYTPLFEDELFAFVPEDSDLARRDPVTLRELLQLPLAMPLKGNRQMNQKIMEMAAYEGVEPVFSEYSNTLIQDRMLSVTLGKCCTITCKLPFVSEGLARVRIDNPYNKRQVYAIWRKDVPLTQNMQYLIDFCKSYQPS